MHNLLTALGLQGSAVHLRRKATLFRLAGILSVPHSLPHPVNQEESGHRR